MSITSKRQEIGHNGFRFERPYALIFFQLLKLNKTDILILVRVLKNLKSVPVYCCFAQCNYGRADSCLFFFRLDEWHEQQLK